MSHCEKFLWKLLERAFGGIDFANFNLRHYEKYLF